MPDSNTINIIGHVNTDPAGFKIALHPQYSAGLTGLAGFSHVLVLWWADRADSPALREQLIYKQPYANNPNDVGVFSSRSPSRPNPVGISIVAIQSISIKNGSIITPYIDTENGTPIVDLKPYFPASDRVRDAVVPKWCQHWPGSVEESADFAWAAEFNQP